MRRVAAAVSLIALCVCAKARVAGGQHHARSTLTFELAATADSVFPLFGPTREAEWATGWKPTFVFPNDGSQRGEGAVFTTAAGHDGQRIAYWVMNEYDASARRIRYVRIVPEAIAIQLDIIVTPVGEAAARVDATYTYTALGEQGNSAVDDFAQNAPLVQRHWEAALTQLLARRNR